MQFIKNTDRIKNKIFEHLNHNVKIIDTHEHLRNYHDFSNGLIDFICSSALIKEDLYSAGLDIYKSIDTNNSIYPRTVLNLEKIEKYKHDINSIKTFSKYLRFIFNTSYYRFTLNAFRDLYNFEYKEINVNNWGILSSKIIENYKNIDAWYEYVVKEKCNIEIMIRDLWHEENRFDFIVPVYRFDYLLFYKHRKRLDEFIFRMPWDDYDLFFTALDKKYNQTELTFNDYLKLVDEEITGIISKLRIVGIKIGTAYNRSLNFEYVEESEAKYIFNTDIMEINNNQAKKFQDFIMHKIIQRIIDEKLVIQIHTGMQGVLSNLEFAKPVNLNNLFLLYPKANFDLFHTGFPYSDELLVFCKVAKNAYFNVCWFAQISEVILKRILSEALDLIPNNKILWGGDCATVEEIYGAVSLSKKVVSEVLAEKVSSKKISFNDAIFIAGNIFRNNAKQLYKL